jgi:hypothetical protein
MKRLLIVAAMVLAPYTVQAQVYEWQPIGDSISLTAGYGLTVSTDTLYFNAFNDGFVQPGRQYKIVRTDTSIMLVEAECWKRWLDDDSVSHCGHEIRNGPVDTVFAHDRFITAITKIYWDETDEAEFRITTEVKAKKAE